MEEKKPFGKMKAVGFTCIGFAAVMTVLVVAGIGPEERVQSTIGLIGTWLTTGVGLLTVNAGKRIVGGHVMNKQQDTGK